jgi:hypothetical protein
MKPDNFVPQEIIVSLLGRSSIIWLPYVVCGGAECVRPDRREARNKMAIQPIFMFRQQIVSL